jgi:LuxR family maltose regulon positive regulatory protein
VPQKPPPVSLSPQVLKRDRLFRMIECARAGVGLWISGMAGSGKTTLVASFLQENRFQSLWYQLDRHDGDLPSFFFHFGSALRKISHRIYKSMPLLTPEYLPGTESFISGYFTKLFSRIETPLWMVFDNYHDVPADSGFSVVLTSIFKFAPPGVVVVVISRSNPPPIMARMLALRKLVLIDSSHLAFTESESRDLIRKLASHPLSEDDIRKIYAATRGWVAGIILLMLKPDQIDRLKVTDENHTPGEILDFFGSEVFEKLEKDEQEILLKTALLPDLAPEVAGPLTGNSYSKAILEKLIRWNFFIERKFGPNSVYQYHPLFRNFLLNQFEKRFQGQEARDLDKKAADLLVQAGKSDDAAPLYAKAGDWDSLGLLIHHQASQLISQGRLRIVLSMINLLPDTVVEGDAWLLLWKGVCTIPVSPEEGLDSCRSAYKLFVNQDDLKGCLATLSTIMETCVWLNKPCSEMDAWVNEGGKYIKAAKAGLNQYPVGNLVAGMLAALSLYSPEDPRLGQWEELAHELMRTSPSLDSSIRISEWLLYLNCYRGEIETARTLISWATPFMEKQEGTPSLLRWKIQQCHYYIATSEADHGILAAEEGLKLAEQCGIHHQDFAFLGHKVYFYLVKGDLLAARQGLKQLAQTIRPNSVGEVCYYNYLTCLEAYTSNDFRKAKEIGALAASSTRSYGVKWLLASTLFLLSRINRACGEYDIAAEYMAEVVKIAKTSRSNLVLGWALLAQADEGLELECPHQEHDALAQAFQHLSQKGVIYHPALGRGTMSKLCAEALSCDIDPQIILKYIRTLKLLPPEGSPARKRWPWAVRAYILGSFSIICGDAPLSFSRKAQKRPLELLIMLACCGRRGETREILADQLWPEADGDKAEQALSTTLHRLRRLIGSDQFVVQENERVALSSQHCWVDAWHFEDLVKLADKADDCREKMWLLTEAMDLYRGNATGDYSAIQGYSQVLLDKAIKAVQTLGDLHEQTGDWQQATNCYRRGVLIAPLEETLYQRLMKVLGKEGNRTEAAAIYTRCRNALEHDLGILPSKITTDLYRSIMTESETII